MPPETIKRPEFNSEINFLAETAMAFSSSSITTEIYDYIGDCLKILNPQATVIVNSIDGENKIMRTEYFNVSGKLISKVIRLLGFRPVGKVFHHDHTVLELASGNLRKFDKGLYELSFRTINPDISKKLENLLRIDSIWGIAFLIEQRIFANAVMLIPEGNAVNHPEVIETFARQVSVTLKRIEAEKKEERFRSMFQYMTQGAFYQLASGAITDVNEAALKIFGLNREEVLKKDVKNPGWKIIGENHMELAINEYPGRAAILSGKPVVDKVVGIFNKLMDEVIWVIATAIPEFLPGESRPYRAFVIMQDITQRKAAEENLNNLLIKHKISEENLRISETRLRALVEAMPDLIFRMDDNCVYLDYRAPKDQLHIQELDLIGKNNRDLTPKEFADLVEEKVRLTLSSGQRQEFEYQLYIPGKGNQHFDARMAPSGEKEVITIVRNITARKDSERRIIESETNARALMEATPHVMILIDKSHKVIDTNEAHAKRLGRNRSDLIGKSFFEFLPGETANQRMKMIDTVIHTGIPVTSEDFRGGYWNEISIYPVKNLNGEIDRVAIFAQDITGKKNDELRLKENERKLKELNESKDRFFSIIAHDLKSPFNSILGFSNTLAEEASGLDISEIKEFARIINSSANHTYELLHNLLEWAMMEQGKWPFVARNMLIHELAQTVINLCKPQADRKNIVLYNTISENQIVYADENMMKTVLRNLLTNAIKFTRENGMVTISSVLDQTGEVHISVADNGVGIRPEHMENLFNLGKNIITRGTAKEKGTGLGLILCKEFIEKHGGRIWVKSEPDKGSTVHFSLPRRSETTIPGRTENIGLTL